MNKLYKIIILSSLFNERHFLGELANREKLTSRIEKKSKLFIRYPTGPSELQLYIKDA